MTPSETVQSVAEPSAAVARRARTARVVVLLVVLVAGAFMLLGQEGVAERVRRGDSSTEVLLYAPAVFIGLTLVVIADALLVAFRRRFVSGRGLLQVVVALVLAAYVATTTWREYQARQVPELLKDAALSELFRSGDARVRALVVEVAARRGEDGPARAALLLAGLDDKDPLVWRTVLVTRFAALLEGQDEAEARRQARSLVAAELENGGAP